MLTLFVMLAFLVGVMAFQPPTRCNGVRRIRRDGSSSIVSSKLPRLALQPNVHSRHHPSVVNGINSITHSSSRLSLSLSDLEQEDSWEFSSWSSPHNPLLPKKKTADDYQSTDISYLFPESLSKDSYLPPKTTDLLRKVTHLYVHSDIRKDYQDLITLEEVLEVIDEEYNFQSTPLSVGSLHSSMSHKNQVNKIDSSDSSDSGEVMYNDGNQLLEQENFGKILCFAVMHGLPAEITLILLRTNRAQESEDQNVGNNHYQAFLEQFEKHQWGGVSFPEGLNLRLKYHYIPSKRKKLRTIIVPSRLIKVKAITEANLALNKAANASLPTKLMTAQQAVAEINRMEHQLLGPTGIDPNFETSLESSEDSSIKDTNLPFFPSQGIILQKKIQAIMYGQLKRLRQAGRGGMISYGMLTLLWFSISITWQWNRAMNPLHNRVSGITAATASTACFTYMHTVWSSLRKISNILLSTYIGSHLTIIPRLALSVAMAPKAERLLLNIRDKLDSIDTDRSSGLIASTLEDVALVGMSIGLFSFVVIGDLALSFRRRSEAY